MMWWYHPYLCSIIRSVIHILSLFFWRYLKSHLFIWFLSLQLLYRTKLTQPQPNAAALFCSTSVRIQKRVTSPISVPFTEIPSSCRLSQFGCIHLRKSRTEPFFSGWMQTVTASQLEDAACIISHWRKKGLSVGFVSTIGAQKCERCHGDSSVFKNIYNMQPGNICPWCSLSLSLSLSD